MRLHRLTLSAFGPFAGTEEVDFDELNDAGLFLMTGPTGAGKSSVLDAICFALYGQVPGVRGVKALRSQHAVPDACPEVTLDFSVRERRFVIRRTPEWSRPKRRGEGFTTEKANATLIETTSGSDHLLSSRAQEVGHFVDELIGMHAAQFVQVAMLPQGEFQHFLQATSQDRHAILERLFRTDRFSRIEDWVADHSRELRDKAGDGHRRVQRLLDGIADRAGVELPERLCDDALSGTGDPLGWAEAVQAEREEALTACLTDLVGAQARLDQERARHTDAEETHRALTQRAEATAAVAALEQTQQVEDDARARLEADARASRCDGLLAMLDEAQQRFTDLQAEADVAHGRLADVASAHDLHGTVPTPADLADLERSVRATITRVEALLPRERALEQARTALTSAEHGLADRQARLLAETARLDGLPQQRGRMTTELEAVRSTAQRGPATAFALRSATDRLAAAEKVPALEERLAELETRERAARDDAADARERMLDVVERRLAGIAAELAGRLEDDAPCQVCGSLEHPAPAPPYEHAVTEADQEQATKAYDALSATHRTASRATADCRSALEVARGASGEMDPAAAAIEVAALREALAASERAAAAQVDLEQRLFKLEQEEKSLTTTVHELRTETATLAQAVSTGERQIQEIEAELATSADEGPVPLAGQVSGPLTGVLDGLRADLAMIGLVSKAVTAADDARRRMEELTRQATDQMLEHGFTTPDAARAARLRPMAAEELAATVAEREERRTRARHTLAEPAVQAVDGRALPDLAQSRQSLDEAERAKATADRAAHLAGQTVESLRSALQRLDETTRQWAPVRDESARAESMSKLVRGIGSDNHLQMRLSAYVLATRLDQVLDAANERLAHMRDQRYLLQRTGRAARKRSQAGLGLQIVDEWTGETREATTLSGGETFVVSLALALGLADVVSNEAGGVEIETLFVDEGFGMLDADTLDDVMDRLDGLRAGGRTVGVVSHVAEIRNRIPTQVHVDKTRNGSKIALRTTVA